MLRQRLFRGNHLQMTIHFSFSSRLQKNRLPNDLKTKFAPSKSKKVSKTVAQS